MMNEHLKFRAYHKELKQMFQLHSFCWRAIKTVEQVGKMFVVENYEIKDFEPIQQFICVLDKNKTEIFEGDILRNARGECGIVVRKDHHWELTVSETQSSMYTKEFFENSEIVGNIHTHPDFFQS